MLQQEVITPDIDDIWIRKDLETYRQATLDLAIQYQIPLIDPKDLMDRNADVNLYFDHQELQ